MFVLRMIMLCVLVIVLLGCKFTNEAVLVGSDGHLYYGRISFNPEDQTGTIDFPYTPYGEVSGPFTLTVTDEKKPVIKLDRIPLDKFSGKAHLAGSEARHLECQITADFKTTGAGDMKMVGCGTCCDEYRNTFDISFE